MNTPLKNYINQYSDSSPLIVFRIGFGILMCYSLIRFWLKGWIETLYLNPSFHFSYYGFEWVKPIDEYTYLIFILCFISSFFVAIGYRYKLSIILFFLSFTYIEMMDKTTYLNHYYFISILSFIMIFLPANVGYSLDSYLNKKYYVKIPRWNIDIIKILIAIVYLYSGVAKMNSDWLFQAMPLKIWLTSKYDLPIIGESLMQKNWVHYFMSWGGMIYDLTIPFLLIEKRTRILGFALVVFFHVFTAVLFPIGMFPYIMIFSSLIFFNQRFHKKTLKYLEQLLISIKPNLDLEKTKIINNSKTKFEKIKLSVVTVFLIVQLLFPLRYFLYPGELFWHEQGYRFSWRVMLMDKVGYTTFKIKEKRSGDTFMVNNENFLTPFQEKQMSFQPDFILEFAHYLGDKFSDEFNEVEVYAESFVALNGRPSQRFIDPEVNLYAEVESFKNKTWVLPLNDEIKGF